MHCTSRHHGSNAILTMRNMNRTNVQLRSAIRSWMPFASSSISNMPHVQQHVGCVPSRFASNFVLTSLPTLQQTLRMHSTSNTENQKASSAEDSKASSEENEKSQKEFENMHFIRREYLGLRQDIREYPDIYNAVNAFQFILFTVFCLSSTGSKAEEEFWIRMCGIDLQWGSLLAPLLHVFLTTNFLSMAFAMLLLHNLGHTVIQAVGAPFLLRYLSVVALGSGALMCGMKMFFPNIGQGEVQYGPWDIIVGLFVVSAATSGYSPLQLLGSFSGWVKYAAFLGAGVIMYYDWQPCVFGFLVAYGLHRSGISRIPSTVAAS